jgi:hypothetical protein
MLWLMESHTSDDVVPTRELEALSLLTQGLRLEEIGERLGLSPKTAANHQSSIKQKLGASSALQLIWRSLRTEDDVLRVYRDGPYEESAYFLGKRKYSALHTCNTWGAEALRAAGFHVHTGGVVFAWQLWVQARRLKRLEDRAAGPLELPCSLQGGLAAVLADHRRLRARRYDHGRFRRRIRAAAANGSNAKTGVLWGPTARPISIRHRHISVGDYAVLRDARIIATHGYDRNRTRINGTSLE